MKKSVAGLAIFFIVLSSCSKSNNAVQTTGSATNNPPKQAAPLPVPVFRITNTMIVNGSDGVKEGTPIAIENTSQHGVTYLWDFGNGNTSTERTPSNIYLYPCTQTSTVTLTVTNKDGVSKSYSQSYYVVCYRTAGGHIDGTMPAGWQQH